MPNNEYANEPNQSRSEDIIQSILDGTEYDEAARSRIEYLLIELKNAIEGGGGGGGVTSYSPLTEKPKIDNHTLQSGNNTSSDLGLQTKIDADHKLSADVIDDTNTTNKFNVKSDWNAASGTAGEILNKPTLGTASAKNVPASGDAATGEVVLGSDTRLTDARNAKDVYNWAKQENKPSYGYSEIQNTPTIPDKLSDLTDDTTHRTVTDTEKNTWNGKQNALTFDNAPTSNSNNPVKSGGVYTALSGKQNNLSEEQMAAANSGIDSTKVAQIETNKNNILLNTNNGVKNIWKLTIPSDLPSGFTIAKDTDGGYIFNGTTGSSALVCSTNIYFGSGDYVLSGCPANGSDESYRLDILRGANTNYCYGEPVVASGFTNTSYQCRIRIAPNYTCNNLKFYPMICPKSLYDADPTYQPYALSNAELTAKEQVNENNISSLNQYAGGKNKFNIDSATINASDASYTKNSDGTINVTKSTNTIGQVNMQQAFLGETGTYIISGCPSGGSSTTYEMLIQSGNTVLARDYGEGASVSLTKGTEYQFKVVIRESQALSNKLFKPMISIEGGEYQPYALSNAELTEEVEPLIEPVSGSVTWATGYTPSTSEVRIRQYGNIVCGQIYALFSDALPASTETTVGTITGVDKAGASLRLLVGVAPSALYGTPTGMAYGFISSSTGSIVLKTGANETGKAFCINFTYTTADPS